jgi:hypothetical protein
MVLLGFLAVVFLFWYITTMLRAQKLVRIQFSPVFLGATSRVQSPLFPPYWFSEGY